jgi:hypothetical protein
MRPRATQLIDATLDVETLKYFIPECKPRQTQPALLEVKLSITDRSKDFPALLQNFRACAPMPFEPHLLRIKINRIQIPVVKKLADVDYGFLFNYQIFPPNIMRCFSQWHEENRPMQVGDAIVQQANFPPLPFSCKMIIAVRISGIVNSDGQKGFSYVTLEGHAERGESSFALESTEEGLAFTISTRSESGNLLTQIAAPLITLPYQAYCTQMALKNVRNTVMNQ